MTALRELSTEAPNPRSANLDRHSTQELLQLINEEDQAVPLAVGRAIPQIELVVEAIVKRLSDGGRLFYLGAGTSGRLGCVDASEMPPTYGVSPTLVQGIIAGGPSAMLSSIEGAEDDAEAGVADLLARGFGARDVLIGLSVSGRARYVQAGLIAARERGGFTACITCNWNSALIPLVDVPIVVETGAEVVAGSTRMKAGTAQKLVLNMLSTATMVKLGHVVGNRMIDVQLKCEKLRERARDIVMERTGASAEEALNMLVQAGGSVRRALGAFTDRQV